MLCAAYMLTVSQGRPLSFVVWAAEDISEAVMISDDAHASEHEQSGSLCCVGLS